MNDFLRTVLWQQLGASLDMLENAIKRCPLDVWGTKFAFDEYWYISYHTLFFLDLYLSDGLDGFTPLEPFGLSELDPEGKFPERVYSQEELLVYLEHSRKKAQHRIKTLTDEKAKQICDYHYLKGNVLEMLFDTMRHVQHHTAQLHLLLRQKIDDAPKWVMRTKTEF